MRSSLKRPVTGSNHVFYVSNVTRNVVPSGHGYSMRYGLLIILLTSLLAACQLGESPSAVVSSVTESTVASTEAPTEPAASSVVTTGPPPTPTPSGCEMYGGRHCCPDQVTDGYSCPSWTPTPTLTPVSPTPTLTPVSPTPTPTETSVTAREAAFAKEAGIILYKEQEFQAAIKAFDVVIDFDP